MDKGNKASFRPDTRLFVNKLHALCLKPSERRPDIFNLYGYVMNAAAAFFKKLRYRRIFGGRLEQFNAGLADRQHRNPHLLILDDLGMNILKPEGVLPKLESFINAFCRNA